MSNHTNKLKLKKQNTSSLSAIKASETNHNTMSYSFTNQQHHDDIKPCMSQEDGIDQQCYHKYNDDEDLILTWPKAEEEVEVYNHYHDQDISNYNSPMQIPNSKFDPFLDVHINDIYHHSLHSDEESTFSAPLKEVTTLRSNFLRRGKSLSSLITRVSSVARRGRKKKVPLTDEVEASHRGKDLTLNTNVRTLAKYNDEQIEGELVRSGSWMRRILRRNSNALWGQLPARLRSMTPWFRRQFPSNTSDSNYKQEMNTVQEESDSDHTFLARIKAMMDDEPEVEVWWEGDNFTLIAWMDDYDYQPESFDSSDDETESTTSSYCSAMFSESSDHDSESEVSDSETSDDETKSTAFSFCSEPSISSSASMSSASTSSLIGESSNSVPDVIYFDQISVTEFNVSAYTLYPIQEEEGE